VEETKTILQALHGSIVEGPAMLSVGCGLRLGEAIALRWADVEPLERRRIRATATMYQDGRTEPKSARSRRTVAMPIFVAEYLRTHKVAQNERRLLSVAWAEADYVFDRGGGIPMLLLSVSHRFSKCADAIGLGDVRFHDLRHAYATRLLERGVHPKVVSEALGYSSISITMDTYSHVMPSMSQVAADVIDAVLGE
jgi:integrase